MFAKKCWAVQCELPWLNRRECDDARKPLSICNEADMNSNNECWRTLPKDTFLRHRATISQAIAQWVKSKKATVKPRVQLILSESKNQKNLSRGQKTRKMNFNFRFKKTRLFRHKCVHLLKIQATRKMIFVAFFEGVFFRGLWKLHGEAEMLLWVEPNEELKGIERSSFAGLNFEVFYCCRTRSFPKKKK